MSISKHKEELLTALWISGSYETLLALVSQKRRFLTGGAKTSENRRLQPATNW